jgi:hypothetical protein
MKRLPPSERTREAITEMLESGLAGAEDPLSELVRLAAATMGGVRRRRRPGTVTATGRVV